VALNILISMGNGIAEPNDKIIKIPFFIEHLAKGTVQKCVGLINLYNLYN
jgi:hypothetical protein